MLKKRAIKREFDTAVNLAASKKARRGIILVAVTTTIVACASAIIATERILNTMSTRADWSTLDWGMEEEDTEI